MPIRSPGARTHRESPPENLDLAVGIPSGVAILLGNGIGAFGPETDIALAAGATTLAVGDFKGDGRRESIRP